jgi:hypothetical protein
MRTASEQLNLGLDGEVVTSGDALDDNERDMPCRVSMASKV